MSRFAIFAGIGAIVLAVIGWDETKLAGVTKASPTSLKLANLKPTGGPDGNRHVTISDFEYAGDYVYVTKRSSWQSVWIPVTLPKQRTPVALIKSTRLRNEGDVNSFMSSNGPLTGIITNDINTLGSRELSKLQEGHGGTDFKSLPVIEERKSVPSKTLGYGLYAGATLLFVIAGLLGFLAWKKSQEEPPKKRRKRDEDDEDELDDDDEFEEPRPSKRRRERAEAEEPRRKRTRFEDEDNDENEDDRPRRRRRE